MKYALAVLCTLLLCTLSAHAATYSTLQWSLAAGNVPAAWPHTTGVGVKVCDVDTGVWMAHPDLAGAVIGGVNAVTPGSNSYIDDMGHGTHTAGIIAGRGIDVTGVAPGASLLIAKVLDSTGSGSDASVTAGMLWCINQGAQVVNLSLGGPSVSYDGFYAVVRYGCAHGVDFSVAAGNSGDATPADPAYIVSPCLVAVEAADKRGNLANFSSFAQNKRSVVAPGQNIISDLPNNLVGMDSGTSMATPFVTGELALLRSVGDNAQTAIADVLATAHRRKHQDKYTYGFGNVNVGKAVKLALSHPH